MNQFPAFKNKSLQNIENEKWKELPGFFGNYLLSDFGRVKSLPRLVERASGDYWTKEKIMSIRIQKQKVTGTDKHSSLLALTYKYNLKV